MGRGFQSIWLDDNRYYASGIEITADVWQWNKDAALEQLQRLERSVPSYHLCVCVYIKLCNICVDIVFVCFVVLNHKQ